ncbi:MAG TPA: hypothetical protein VJC21_01765 [Candidatus Nanoarchaeia archaeon]|nr:hypothetical protein [Candidatus Nanoarchaeia archaeon]
MNLETITAALQKAWCSETSSDPDHWHPENPAWGQCAVTALMVNDYLGGKIIWAEAALPDGRKVSHYFLKLLLGGIMYSFVPDNPGK